MASARIVRLTCLTACFASASAFAQLEPEDPGKVSPAKHGQQLLRDMAAYLANTDRVQFAYRSAIEQVAEGMRWEYWTHYNVAFDRPGRFGLTRVSGYNSIALATDGDTTTIIPSPDFEAYVGGPAQGNLSDLIGQVFENLPHLEFLPGFTPGIATIIAPDPREIIESYVESAVYIGEETVDGTPTSLVRVPIEHGPTLEIWITAGKAPYPRQVRMTTESPAEWGSEATRQIASTLISNWDTTSAFADNAFTLEVNDEWTQYEDLAQLAEGWFGSDHMDGDFGEDDPTHLVGQQAPDFELEMYGGGTWRLSEALGQHKAVVIDFWATWCPPCVEGLPVLHELTSAHGQDIGFYAINLYEDNETIADFLKRRKLTDLRVLLEPDGSVAEAFGVSGIPQTVIIGADGIIRSVHVGFSMDMKPMIEEELDAAVRGLPIDPAHGEDEDMHGE
jgi:peroxiredoxin